MRRGHMKRFILLVSILASAASAQSSHSARGHIRSNGTYVQPHAQTSPNATKLDNWSTKGNYNPRTGKAGTVDPYKPSKSNPNGSPNNKPRGSTRGW